MNDEELKKLVNDLRSLPSENETVEFKANDFSMNIVGVRVSALSNSANLENIKNAYLVFGIEDETHNIIGTKFSPKTAKEGNQPFEFLLNKKITPVFDFRIYEIIIDEKKIVIFQIPPAIDEPIKFEGIAYVRIGSATPKLSDHKDKERKIWSNIEKKSFEKGIAKENLTVSEVLELLDYSSYFSLTKQELPAETNKFIEKMGQHLLVKKVFNDNYDITNLGAILFAKDLNNFPTVKRKSVRVIHYEGDSRLKRLNEREDKMGYAVGWSNLIQYINDRLPFNEKILKDFREEKRMYPDEAVREFVANALIHQDLSVSGAGPMVEIFDKRVEITNTGDPLIEIDRFIDHPPKSRNEDMASFMRQVKICEESGSGVDRALIEINLYQLPAPLFESYRESVDKFTKVTLFSHKDLKDMTSEDKIRTCYQHCVLLYVEKKRMTNATLRERLGISDANYPTASNIIKETKEAGKIKESEKSKEYVPEWV
ncbi:MAG: putative DNA binding domain-containing protein [Spirochaetes bacterium]|nr:putative DNA binding domain-containing protein [Spirochaetota bacterium]